MPKTYKFTTNRGKILKNYKKFMETKDRLVSIIKYIGIVDSQTSLRNTIIKEKFS